MKIIGRIMMTCVIPILGLSVVDETISTDRLYTGFTYELSNTLVEEEFKEIQKASVEIIENTVEEETQQEKKPKKQKKKKTKYTSAYVNFRKKPHMNGKVLTVLDPNTKVTYIKEKKGWSYVLIEDTYGYIKSDYLKNKKVPISKLNRWGIELSEDEINLLAKIVWLEARGEEQVGREAVVEVVFNRINSKYYGNDVYSVLSEKGQFTSWSSRNNANPSKKEYKAIRDVLKGSTSIMSFDYLYFSTGKSNGKDFFRIGNHWFGRI